MQPRGEMLEDRRRMQEGVLLVATLLYLGANRSWKEEVAGLCYKVTRLVT